MREFLFRGKRADNGEWVYGFYVPVNYAKPLIVTGADIDDYSEIEFDDYYHVNNTTVGQDTGLTDKNGKKIFEGDCFETCCTGLPVYKHIVGYYPEHFAFMARCIEMNTVHYLSDYRPSAIEVIGNIHDNPELLEVSN